MNLSKDTPDSANYNLPILTRQYQIGLPKLIPDGVDNNSPNGFDNDLQH